MKQVLAVVFSLLGLYPVASQAKAPITEPVVTTIVKQHPGAVGGLAIDQLEYLYIADFQETIWRLNLDNLAITEHARGFYGASGATVDHNGDLYQANYFGHAIDRVSRTGEVSRFVSEGLNGPVGLVFDKDQNLLVCDCNSQSIKKVDKEGAVSDFARSPHFNCPNGIARDEDGNFYVVSFSASKIVKITPEGESSEFADTRGKGLGHITYVNGVFYATSYNDNRVYRITRAGKVSLLAGTGERAQKDGPAQKASFSNPNGIAANQLGNYLYINDYIGDPNATGMGITPFSIRRIELPNLSLILDYELENGSIDSMRAAYKKYQADPRTAGEFTFPSVNQLGWKYMGKEMYPTAVALFELNAESNPDSWNAYSSLGGGYMKNGQNDKAIASLQRSLELNPKNAVARGRLEALGVPQEKSESE